MLSAAIEISGERRVIRLLKDTGARARDLSAPMADLGERLVRRIGNRISKVLNEKTGRLKGSLDYEESVDGLVVTAGGRSAGGSDAVRYARIQHKGGIIKPKKAKALTIPFPGGPADKRVPLRARDFKDTFIAKGIIFRALSRGRSGGSIIEPLFILKKKVEIPASPYMYMEKSDVKYLKRSVASYITGAWGE